MVDQQKQSQQILNSIEQAEMLLCYKSTTIYKNDLCSFHEGSWLNSSSISFYNDYLEETKLKGNKDIFIMNPLFVSLLIYEQESGNLEGLTEGLELESKKYIFVPLNDNIDRTKIYGGNHWSLIIFGVQEKKFYYFDSMKTIITDAAKQIIRILCSICKIDLLKDSIVTADCSKQNNSFDCGIYVLLFTEFYIDQLLKQNDKTLDYIIKESKQQSLFSDKDALKLRKQIFELMTSMIKERAIKKLQLGN